MKFDTLEVQKYTEDEFVECFCYVCPLKVQLFFNETPTFISISYFYNPKPFSFFQSGLSHHDWQHHCDNGLFAALAFAVRVALIDPYGGREGRTGQHWNIDCVDIH